MAHEDERTVDPGDVAKDPAFEDLLVFIRDSRGFDFTGYKRTSLGRRIGKRMNELGVTSFADYRDCLESDPDEFRILFNTILINVTSFFRDGESWAYLRDEIAPELVAAVPADREIRIWSAGCSTGEEAYTIAMVFADVMGLDEAVSRLKVYGTDVDDEALRDARTGMYARKSLDSLPDGFREQYFVPNGSQFVFRADLRRRVIFGRHDVTQDAPISGLELLVCRNTLMYFNLEAQLQMLDRFHFALRPGGVLFLGKAEMLLSDSERFEVTNMRHRMFRRRHGDVSGTERVPVRSAIPFRPGGAVARKNELRDQLLDANPYANIAIDNQGLVGAINSQARVQFGLTAHDVGRPFRDLEISYRPAELRSLIDRATRERRITRLNGVEYEPADGESLVFDIVIQPLPGSSGLIAGTSVTFVDVTLLTRLQRETKHIRQDLETAYEELQATNEELETTNEELQSSIEELETTNEELQSTNEELETTNEELQSGNEELETMNDELRLRSNDLDQAHAFLEGVVSSIASCVAVLDADLKVRSWNSGAEDLWGLRTSEVRDQPFFELDFGLPVAELQETVRGCLSTGERSEPLEVSAVNRRGRPITCRVTCSPLTTGQPGVVLLMEEGRG
jgi:two-component system CheB/CheR fusion protein